MPKNFQDYLRNTKNKEELFQFLTDFVAETCTVDDDKELHITNGKLRIKCIPEQEYQLESVRYGKEMKLNMPKGLRDKQNTIVHKERILKHK